MPLRLRQSVRQLFKQEAYTLVGFLLPQREHLVQGMGQNISADAAHILLQLRNVVLHFRECLDREIANPGMGECRNREIVVFVVSDANEIPRVHERHHLAFSAR